MVVDPVSVAIISGVAGTVLGRRQKKKKEKRERQELREALDRLSDEQEELEEERMNESAQFDMKIQMLKNDLEKKQRDLDQQAIERQKKDLEEREKKLRERERSQFAQQKEENSVQPPPYFASANAPFQQPSTSEWDKSTRMYRSWDKYSGTYKYWDGNQWIFLEPGKSGDF